MARKGVDITRREQLAWPKRSETIVEAKADRVGCRQQMSDVVGMPAFKKVDKMLQVD